MFYIRRFEILEKLPPSAGSPLLSASSPNWLRDRRPVLRTGYAKRLWKSRRQAREATLEKSPTTTNHTDIE